MIAVPLIARGRTLGALVMINAESLEAFSTDDFALAKNVASRAALCLDNARLFEQRQRDAAFQRFIAHASEVLSSSLDLQATLNGLLQLVVPEFAQLGIINLIDEHDGTAKAAAVIHANPQKAQLASNLRGHSYLSYLSVEASQVPHALRTGTSQIVARVDEDFIRMVVRPEFVSTLVEIELGSSLVSIPLVARGRLLGALTFAVGQAEDRRVYTESDLPLFEELARRASIAILNARDFAAEREPESVGKDDQCELGKRLCVEGRKYASLSAFTDLKGKHTKFHAVAASVVYSRLTEEEEFDDCFTAALDVVDEGQGLKDYWSKVALDFGAGIVATVGYLALALNRPSLFSHAGVVELLDAADYERVYPKGIEGGELRSNKTGKKTKQRRLREAVVAIEAEKKAKEQAEIPARLAGGGLIPKAMRAAALQLFVQVRRDGHRIFPG